jgi:DNA helicase II / ATP-dependent DNA helicase PcrA
MIEQTQQEQLLEKIKKLHSGDDKQLEVIFSDLKRLIIEAPAGYGKTKTMISKIAHLIATERVPNPKKILALTFSVNAAYKIKKDVSEHLPSLLQTTSLGLNNQIIRDKLFISNYHGFCRNILKKYGYLLHPKLGKLDSLNTIDDSRNQEVTTSLGISFANSEIFSKFSDAVKSVDIKYLNKHFQYYTDSIIKIFIDKNYISYNSIIALTLKLFNEFKDILLFYQHYFPIIIVDEFQDTNILSWALLRKLVSNESEVIFMGDSLQRIYGFIGAVPNLMNKAEKDLSLKKIVLDRNYRFMKNAEMLQLDKNIRLNAENSGNVVIEKEANIPFMLAGNQIEEADEIVKKINSLLSLNKNNVTKVAILTRQGGNNYNTTTITTALNNQNVPYFYGLFNEDSKDYLDFHRKCQSLFKDYPTNHSNISPKKLNQFFNRVNSDFQDTESPIIKSLLSLLNIFLFKVLPSFSFLSIEDRLLLIRDAFENKNLKQNMEYISENVIISTIHGAKGLEWDYVFMPDMEKFSMPNYQGLCGSCRFKSDCKFKISSDNEKYFLEELSVFYVGVTRAKKSVYFSASKERLNKDGESKPTNISCMLNLPGIITDSW